MNGKLSPFGRAVPVRRPLAEVIAEMAPYGVPPHEAVRNYDHVAALETWKNDEYQVSIDKAPKHGFGPMTIWHLSIKRIDRETLHDWRDLQAIKNALCGDEAEAIELYPAQSRVVDTSNQYHLFVFMADADRAFPTFPVGWTAGMVLEPDTKDGSFHVGRARQRPLAKGAKR